MIPSTIAAATRIVVERYDESLKQIAHLKRENHALREFIQVNEIKTLNMIEHYNAEIDAQTKFANDLKDELCARDQLEQLRRHRNFRDQSTGIEEGELQSKENELVAVIYALEDEIQRLKDDEKIRLQNYERMALENEANVKKSFLQDIEAFRCHLSSSVCNEVRGALADTAADNQRLAFQFGLLLQEMEKIQVSRDEKDKELSRLKLEHQLMRRHMYHVKDRRTPEHAYLDPMELESGKINNDSSGNEEKTPSDIGLENYFKKCLEVTQRSKSPTASNDDDVGANHSKTEH
ncbi:hypothetical protein ACHAXA_001640 [Cyclostephanos tholiformis]|uniref:Uncharacterized protein n=1 Tax=Cyclostephanos tholiformis TaxID=382380 RepID=A0ABD3RVA5_9STRA